MKTKKLRVKGIGRIADTELPIAKLSDSDKLVAVRGRNGSGKTTLLGCIPGALYLRVPTYGPLASLATERDSLVDLTVEVAGKEIRAKVASNADVAATKTKAWAWCDGVEIASTGKVSDYKRALADLIPPYETYLASAFAAQTGEGRFLDLPRADRRELFARMLRLGDLQALSERARAKATEAMTARGLAAAAVEALQSQAEDPADLRRKLSGTESALSAAMDDLEIQQAAAAIEEKTVKRWEKKREAAARVLAVAETEHVNSAALCDEKTRALGLATKHVSALKEKIAKLDKRLDGKAELEKAASLGNALAASVAELEHRQAACQERTAVEQALALVMAKKQSVVDKLTAAKESAERELESERVRASVSGAPCTEDLFVVCPLAASIVESRARLPELSDAVARATDDIIRLQNDTTEEDKIRAQISSDWPLDPWTAELSAQLRKDKVALSEVGEAKISLAILEELEKNRADLESQLVSSESDLVVAEDQFTAARKDRESKHSSKVRAAELLSDIEDNRPVATVTDRVDRLTKLVATHNAEAAALRSRISAAESIAEAILAKATEESIALTDGDDWHELHRALGPRGAQALLIDAAGPGVSDLANDLLATCYGDRFALRLTTTADLASGKGTKEVFDLTVIDNERGREANGEQYSGGEKVVINEAISLAIAIYNAQQSQCSIDDLVRDECSGSLDTYTAPRYIALLRKAIELGGFSRCYFIAHQDELVDLADAIIDLNDGKAY